MPKSEFHFEDILLDKEVQDDFIGFPIAEKVFRLVRILSFFLILFVAFQVFRIGVFQHDSYEERALANIENFRLFQAERGLISDRFHETLAENVSAFSAYIVPRDLPDDEKERDQIFAALSEYFGLDRETLQARVREEEKYFDSRVLLSADVPPEQIEEVSSFSYPGFLLEEGFRRAYYSSPVFSHILGYTAPVNEDDLRAKSNLVLRDEIGRSGLEAYYDEYLRGVRGLQMYVRDSLGDVLETQLVRNSERGYTLTTNIDREFQEYFYTRMKRELEALGRDIGVGIAMNPQNGEVLALFGIPGYDASRLVEYLDDGDRPLFNRAVSGLYSPGSTIKPLHAVAALEEGVVTPLTSIFSAGYLRVSSPANPGYSQVFHDWAAHGWVNVRSALAVSSNVYFYEIGGGYQKQKGLGIGRLKKWWQEFRLDKKTGIDLPAEVSGFLPDPEWKKSAFNREWFQGDTYNVSIGQGDLLITPLELLSYISAIANGGKFYRPRIMREVLDEKGDVYSRSLPVILRDIGEKISGALDDVRSGMLDAVAMPRGTAYMLHDLPFAVAAKTGSAQVENNRKTNAFFVGYGPVSGTEDKEQRTGNSELASGGTEPELAILVLVENAREGSLNVVPIAKDVFAWYYENRIKGGK
ncbi:MAG: penicillin-binding transpeptidase domain-containing protein [Candidatus Wolfebacteria bacterium]|nr:penicillin-binding transpeptidase domain-containing protein [Candidatus Wolfebacteria bacterium]